MGTNSFFITGASGVFGQWITCFLDWVVARDLGFPHTAMLLRESDLKSKKNSNVISGDIQNFTFPKDEYDYLINLAAPSAKDTFKGMAENEKLMQLVNGTEHVLEFAKKNVKKRTLMVSSGAIYGGFGPKRRKPIAETERIAPSFSNGDAGLAIGKRALEVITKNYCATGSVDASIARCFSFLGPKLPTNLHYAAGNFVKNAISGTPITINGDGTPIRSFMFLGDMVFWLMTILFDGAHGEDYNVGSSEAATIRKLAEIISSVVGENKTVKILNKSNKSVGNPTNYFYVPNLSKAEGHLNLSQLTSLKQSVINFVKYEQMKKDFIS